jgi:hypothetical protein
MLSPTRWRRLRASGSSKVHRVMDVIFCAAVGSQHEQACRTVKCLHRRGGIADLSVANSRDRASYTDPLLRCVWIPLERSSS